MVTLPDSPLPGPMPQRELAIASDGTTDPVSRAAYAVAADGIELAGEPVAQARQQNTAHQALVLWRLDGPLRLRSRRTGVFGNGDIYGAGRLTVWDCRKGRLLLTVLGKSGKPIQIVQNERLVRTLDVPNGSSQFVAVPVDARPLADGPVHLRREERRDLRDDAVPVRALDPARRRQQPAQLVLAPLGQLRLGAGEALGALGPVEEADRRDEAAADALDRLVAPEARVLDEPHGRLRLEPGVGELLLAAAPPSGSAPGRAAAATGRSG